MRDRRAERFEATQQEILDVAWGLVRADGLAGLSMRELGARVGLRAQSLYVYFPSKHAIYDAMFRAANEELLLRMQAVSAMDGSPDDRFRRRTRAFIDFATADPARAQLLFVRSLPGFEPTPEAYAPAVQVLDLARDALGAMGVTDDELVDIWTATVSGLIQQQLANDPGGDRWVRLLDDVIEMYLAFARSRTKQ